jgi:ubiquinone/menaquinone biosynthesis C-methylase UbiE
MSNEEKERGPLTASWQSKDAAVSYAQQMKRHQNSSTEEATRLMLEAAAVREGSHILDIAAGTGAQSLLAAQQVGPTGTVLATDISAEMLKVAAHLAEQEGFTTITTRVMNAEQLDLADETFDAVICRLGLMLISHQQKALREILRVLKPERKLAALVWSTPDRHPGFSIPLALAAKYGATTTLSPDPFSLGGSGVFEQALSSAGFHNVSVQTVSIQLHFPSWEAVLPLNATMPNVIKQLNQQDQLRWQEEVKQAMSQFEGPEGLIIPAELLLGEGTK